MDLDYLEVIIISKRKLLAKVTKDYQNRVRECRLRAMLAKQEDLARITGINRSTINALENNRVFLSSHYALIIASALGCTVDELYSKREPKKDSSACG